MGKLGTREIVGTALMASIAVVLEILPLDIPFPLYQRVTLDPTGIPLMFALYYYGLSSSVIATLVTGLSIALPRPPFRRANPTGAFFKTFAELSTILGVFLILKFTKKGNRLLENISGAFFRLAVMTVVNYVFLPFFYGLSTKIVLKILPYLAIFNAVQAILNIVSAQILFEAVKKRSHWKITKIAMAKNGSKRN